MQETIDAIQRLKNNRAPGKDQIPSECLKYGGKALHEAMHKLITNIWKYESIPEDWKESIIIPIHKKGDKLLCKNYRGISLINSAYKILSNIILKRITPFAEACLGDYQCGFRSNRSTIDQIFTIRQLLEKSWEFNLNIHQLFVDFKQAYDSLLRVELWKAMAELSIPQKLINLTNICMKGSKSRVRIGNKTSDIFLIEDGLRQGDALSPILFNIALEKAIRAAEIQIQVFSNQGPQLLLAYADDIDVVARSVTKVKEAFVKMEKEAGYMGLRVNEDKTKYMLMSRQTQRDRLGQNVTMNEYNFERVESFKYLGVSITAENNVAEEIKGRIQSGNKCIFALKDIFRSKNLSRTSKVQIYKTIVRPVVLYGSETWTTTKESERKLRCFERRVLRMIFGLTKDQTTNEYRPRTNNELGELYNHPDIIQEMKSQRLRWAGHVRRQPDSRIVRLAWDEVPNSKRPLGRPRLRWRDNIAADLKTMGIEDGEEVMRDRSKWRVIVESARTHPGL